MFKEELERFQQQAIITPLGIDEMTEWCNIFVLIPKPNGKVRLCLDPARLNQVLMRASHRGLTLACYHNLKRSSYFTTFTCQFARYRYKRLPFGEALTRDMFQCMIDEIFKNLPNVIGIADDILVLGYDTDGKDHDENTVTGTTHMQAGECKT